MTSDPETHHRRSIRLRGYDYTASGAYFVTICTQDRACIFGDVADGVMCPNDAGRMVKTVWDELPVFYPGVDIDAFVVMPNHIHGIIVLVGAGPRACPDSRACPDLRHDSGRALDSANESGWADQMGQARGPAPTRHIPTRPAPTGLSVADVVHRFKTMTTKRYADGVRQLGWPAFRGRLWHRNYYEHIIRNESSLNRIRRYIDENPWRWASDDENPWRVTS